MSTYDETGRAQTMLAVVEKAEQLTMVETYRSRPDQRYYVPLTIDHDLVGITQKLASNASSGQKDVVVQNGAAYAATDSIVIKDSENRETGTVASVASNTVTLEDNLSHSYTTANGAWLKNVTDSTDVIDFPCLFNEHDLPANFWTAVKADGTDIVVYSPAGVKLKRELVAGSWDRAGHKMELHTKAPTASTTVDTIVHLCYGYVAGAETNDEEVWESTNPVVFSNGTGIATDAPISRTKTAPLTITVTQAGTFDVTVPTAGIVYIKSGTATVTGSPVTLTSDGQVTVEDTGNIILTVGGYVAVYHMNDDPNNTHIIDSTSNNNDGTKKGANEPLEVAGTVGRAQDFDGNDYITVAGSASLAPRTGSWSVEAVFKTAVAARQFLVYYVDAAGEGWWLEIEDAQEAQFVLYDGGASDIHDGDTVGLDDSVWHHIVGCRNEPAGTMDIYLDGSQDDTTKTATNTGGGDINPTATLYMGQTKTLGQFCLTGLQDEIRISSTNREGSWISTTHNTLMSPATFYSVGAVVDREMVVLTVAGESDLATFSEEGKAQAVLSIVEETDLGTFSEEGKAQVILGTVEKAEQLTIGEVGRAQTVLATVEEADLATFLETAKTQVALTIIEETDLATFLETAKSQTILAVVEESDLCTFLETGKAQTVLAVIEESDLATFQELLRGYAILVKLVAVVGRLYEEPPSEQVVLVESGETETYTIVEEGRPQVILVTVEETDAATIDETGKLQEVLVVIEAADLATMYESQEQTVLAVIVGNAIAPAIDETGRLQVVLATLGETDFYVRRDILDQFVVEVRDNSGNLLGVFKDVYGMILQESINAPKVLTFKVPATDTKLSDVTRANELWVRNIRTNVVVAKTRLVRKDDIR